MKIESVSVASLVKDPANVSPTYCDVIVQRWEKLTGNKAINE